MAAVCRVVPLHYRRVGGASAAHHSALAVLRVQEKVDRRALSKLLAVPTCQHANMPTC